MLKFKTLNKVLYQIIRYHSQQDELNTRVIKCTDNFRKAFFFYKIRDINFDYLNN